jgi:uncharacterized protein (DUF2225 family)
MGGLPTLKRRSLTTGQMVVREGDPPGAMYLICSGSVRVYRHDVASVDSTVYLATLGVGDVIGELAPILGQLRSASVQVAAVAARLGLVVPAGLATAADSDAAARGVHVLAVPAHEATIVYPKTIDCPSCGTRFSALTMRMLKDQPAERESDFHNTYRTAYNPYDYEVWVCPNDFYAALPAEFPDLRDKDRRQVAPIVEQVVASWDDVPDFNVKRTLDLRQYSLELALALYTMRQAPHLRLAAIAHRLAWCARERGDIQTEQKWLRQALDEYTSGYAVADLDGAKEELRIQYLGGELSLRLGDIDGAVTWFAQAARHPDLGDHPTWERMIREQWGAARASATAVTESDSA